MQHRPDAPYIFISYASADRERVLPLVDALARARVSVWIDRKGIHGGANYAEEIAEAVAGCAAFVLMCSAASLSSRNVKQEIALAWKYERVYLPLLLEPVAIPRDVEYWLEAAQWVEVLDQDEAVWLPKVLAALALLGVVPIVPQQEEVRLAGRDKELALLREKLAAAKAGKGGLVLIGGEAGIGKTTLAEAALREAAEQGFAVLEGHCFDLAETPPYGPWIDLFAHHTPSPASPPLPAAFAERGSVGTVSSQMALFVAVEDFLRALATRQPVVALLDDLHWADPASLDLVRFLSRSLAALPLLLIVTYRSDELTRRHPLYQLLPQLARDAGAERLDLRRLESDAVRTLVADRYHLPEEETSRLAAYLQARAEGNALFVGELLRSLEEAGTLRREGDGWRLGDLAQVSVPALLRQVIDGRLDRLDANAQLLLAVAAVVGHEVPLDLWAQVVATDEEALLGVIDEATAARLVEATADGLGVRFAHALIREALYEGILPARRRLHHRRIGEALAASPHPDPDAVAYHFEQARDARAVTWLVAAGDRADRLYSYLTAADRHERALALLGDHGDETLRGWLLVRLGVLYRQSDLLRGLDYLESAEPLVLAAQDPALAAYWRASRGLVRCLAGHGRAGLPDLKAGVAAIQALPDDALAAVLPASIRIALETDGESTYTDWLAMTGNLIEARAYGEAMLAARAADAGGRGALPAGDANFGMAMTYAGLGLADRAREFSRRARDEYRRMGNHNMAVMASRVLVRFILLPYYPEQRALFRAAIAEMADDMARIASGGAAMPEAIALMSRLLDSDSAVVEGNWAETRRAARALLESGLTSVFLRQLGAALGAIARGQGDRALAWQMVRRTLPQGADYEPGNQAIHIALPMQQLAPALALDDGDLPAARAWLEAYDRWLAWSGAVLGQSEGHALWAEYYRQMGEREQAHEHAARALAHAIGAAPAARADRRPSAARRTRHRCGTTRGGSGSSRRIARPRGRLPRAVRAGIDAAGDGGAARRDGRDGDGPTATR